MTLCCGGRLVLQLTLCTASFFIPLNLKYKVSKGFKGRVWIVYTGGLKLILSGGCWRESLGEAGLHQIFHKKRGFKYFKKVKLIQSSQSLVLTVL